MNTLSDYLKNNPLQQAKVNLDKDLPFKKDYTTNSWFAVSHFNVEGEQLSFLYHTMIFSFPGKPAICSSCISFTNETTGEYIQDSQTFSLKDITVSEKEFHLETPVSTFKGNIEHMILTSSCKDIEIDAELIPTGYPLLNGGTGCFPMLDMDIYQYSLPMLKTTGTIKVNNKIYPLDCLTWLDRQWQVNKSPDMTWGWMDLNLSTGEYISLWFPIDNYVEKPFATILFPDGSQKVVDVDPIIKSAQSFWKSDVYIYDYPTQWTISVPEFNAKLKVTSSPKEQELRFAEVPALNHYEAASSVSGTFNGKQVSGHCYVELLASMPWSQIQKNLYRNKVGRVLCTTYYKLRSGIGMLLKK